LTDPYYRASDTGVDPEQDHTFDTKLRRVGSLEGTSDLSLSLPPQPPPMTPSQPPHALVAYREHHPRACCGLLASLTTNTNDSNGVWSLDTTIGTAIPDIALLPRHS